MKRSIRAAVGTSLVGATGKTQKDQDKIDDAVAGICAVGAYTEAECHKHSK